MGEQTGKQNYGGMAATPTIRWLAKIFPDSPSPGNQSCSTRGNLFHPSVTLWRCFISGKQPWAGPYEHCPPEPGLRWNGV